MKMRSKQYYVNVHLDSYTYWAYDPRSQFLYTKETLSTLRRLPGIGFLMQKLLNHISEKVFIDGEETFAHSYEKCDGQVIRYIIDYGKRVIYIAQHMLSSCHYFFMLKDLKTFIYLRDHMKKLLKMVKS